MVNTTKKLRYICAQPAITYYIWQVEVMLNNFMQMGINLNNIDIVCWQQNDELPEEWSKLSNNYEARFFFYRDTRETHHYISSIRPNILKQHWKAHPYLKDDAVFYHDCDIVFTKNIKEWITDEMISDDKWYGSDTRWYISHSYIKSKGDDVIQKMCELMELPETLIEGNELNAIGAQYLMKGVDYDYWNRVESDSEILFKEITEQCNEKVKKDPTHHPLQIWCADMWAVLWGGWRLGYETVCHPNFDFSWATSGIDDYYKMNIMHNAGVINSTSGMFYKADYINKLPYNENIIIDKNYASYYYWKEICRTSKKSVLTKK